MGILLQLFIAAVGLFCSCAALSLLAAEQPQWGQGWSRNMVSEDKGLPDSFEPNTGRNAGTSNGSLNWERKHTLRRL